MHLTFDLPDEAATDQMALRLASVISAPLVLGLTGEIGAGKTTLIRGMLRALGITGAIKSPTYALVESYALNLEKDQKFPFKKFSVGKGSLAKAFRKHAIGIHAALESHPWLSKVCERLLPESPCWLDQMVGRESPEKDLHIHHFDLYRIQEEEELDYIGFRDYFTTTSVCCIEWPERIQSGLHCIDIQLTLTMKGLGRELQIHAASAKGHHVLSLLHDVSL